MSTIHGSCRCERVKFTIETPTKFCAHCHCEDCRHSHGAAFVTWVGTLAERFQITHGKDAITRYVSPAGATRSFCSSCGSMLFFQAPRWPGEVHVARAHVRGPIDREPAAHAYFDRHVPWVHVDDDLPKLGGPTGTHPIGQG